MHTALIILCIYCVCRPIQWGLYNTPSQRKLSGFFGKTNITGLNFGYNTLHEWRIGMVNVATSNALTHPCIWNGYTNTHTSMPPHKLQSSQREYSQYRAKENCHLPRPCTPHNKRFFYKDGKYSSVNAANVGRDSHHIRFDLISTEKQYGRGCLNQHFKLLHIHMAMWLIKNIYSC